MSRLVIIGRNSTIWRNLQNDRSMSDAQAISHAEIDGFDFLEGDRVWILSYSRIDQENVSLFEKIAAKHQGTCFYISSATANVASVTRCYRYPTAKAEAESAATRILDAAIIRIGLMYETTDDLPAGTNAATSYGELSKALREFLLGADRPALLLRMITRGFDSRFEKLVFQCYGVLLRALGSRPCLLRPLDLLLRLIGWRWYGYLYLSNRILAAELDDVHGINSSDGA